MKVRKISRTLPITTISAGQIQQTSEGVKIENKIEIKWEGEYTSIEAQNKLYETFPHHVIISMSTDIMKCWEPLDDWIQHAYLQSVDINDNTTIRLD